MKVYNKITQRSPEWFDIRMGKITGTSLEKIIGTKAAQEKIFYDVIAERLSLPDYNEENPMARGIRLEEEARQKYEKLTGNTVYEVGFCESDDNKFIGFSPDGLIEERGKFRGHLEIKCLGSGNHIKAILENQIPKEYWPQIIQGFVVNGDCEWVDFFMYDPRITYQPTIKFRVLREDVAEDIVDHKERQEEFIKRVNEAVKKLISL